MKTLKRIIRHISSHSSKITLKNFVANRSMSTQYLNNLRGTKIDRKPSVTTAVIIHLYYTETWQTFLMELDKLKTIPFDLFITLPLQNKQFAPEILKDFPQAYIFETPNRGRDVLPFIKLVPLLIDNGYRYVLKLHSKKSTHRKDGSEWLDDIVENLVPTKKSVLEELLKTLEQPTTGLIGPEGQYLQLTVNFEANGAHMTEALNAIYHDKSKTQEVLQTRRTDYGFIAGTMFWARLDAIRPIIDKRFTVRRFEPEAGQIDGTFAHALERVFCLVPEIDGKNMYEIGPDGVRKIDYKTDNIPDWSDVYIGPKK